MNVGESLGSITGAVNGDQISEKTDISHNSGFKATEFIKNSNNKDKHFKQSSESFKMPNEISLHVEQQDDSTSVGQVGDFMSDISSTTGFSIQHTESTVKNCENNGNSRTLDTSVKTNGETHKSDIISNIPSLVKPMSNNTSPTKRLPSRRSSSDGAVKAIEGNIANENQKPERGHSFSDSDEKTAALKAKIDEKFNQLEKEMAAKASASGICEKEIIQQQEAVLNLNENATLLLSPDQSAMPAEDTCIFTSGGPAAVLCELKSNVDSRRVRGVSMAEVKELAYARLQEELQKAQLELKLKDEEVARLSQIRDEVGAELEELTASLFEEAHNMVREANVKQATAEKFLKEANLKIEVLQAEVQALKTLVITSTPSMPNPHLHPQIDKRHNGVRSLFTPGHKRSPSNYELCSFKESPPGSPVKEVPILAFSPDNYEVDPVFHQEFLEWHQNPEIDKKHSFLLNIYQEDILPCLHFTNEQLSKEVLCAIEKNTITIESVNGKNPFPKRCSLLEAPRLCKYRMKLGENSEWHYISQLCRNRIAAVCDFFCYIRYIQQGLVKSGIHEIYWEVVRKRRDMALARLGISSP